MAKREFAIRAGRPIEIVLTVALVAFAEGGCGGSTRIGVTGEGGASGSGGGATDSGVGGSGYGDGGRANIGVGGSAGCTPGVNCSPQGGAAGIGGRLQGGAFGSGGRASTGGSPTGGASTGGTPPFDAGSDPNRNRVPAGMVCGRLATIICAAQRSCCQGAPTLAMCETQISDLCRSSTYLDLASANPIIAYDIDRAEAAFTEYEKRASVCDPEIVIRALSDSGFRGVARGTIPPGGVCSPPIGQAGLDNIAYMGSCQDPEVNACIGNSTSPEWTCTTRSGAGGLCMTDLNCADGFYCNWQSPTSVCSPRRPPGAPCSQLLECQSFSCDSNGRCAPPTVDGAYCRLF